MVKILKLFFGMVLLITFFRVATSVKPRVETTLADETKPVSKVVSKPFDLKVAQERIRTLDLELSKLNPFAYSTKDEFESIEWIRPKIERKTFESTVYVYYGKTSSGVSRPRAVVRYYGENWIFWNEALFLVDGEKFIFQPENAPDRHNTSSVWETADTQLNDFFIEKFLGFKSAKVVKYRLQGKSLADFSLSKSRIESIEKMLLMNRIEAEIFELQSKINGQSH